MVYYSQIFSFATLKPKESSYLVRKHKRRFSTTLLTSFSGESAVEVSLTHGSEHNSLPMMTFAPTLPKQTYSLPSLPPPPPAKALQPDTSRVVQRHFQRRVSVSSRRFLLTNTKKSSGSNPKCNIDLVNNKPFWIRIAIYWIFNFEVRRMLP